MAEPSPRSSRLALACALVAAIAVGGAGFLLGRAASERPPAAVAPPAAAPAPKPAPEPASSGVLGRTELIALAAAAADSAAAGSDPGLEIGRADGRRFELRLPFGCTARPARMQPPRCAGATIRKPGPSGSPSIRSSGPRRIGGPPTAPSASGPEPATLPGQTLALAQLFFAGGGRAGRRDGKPYEAVVRMAEDRLDTSAGFRV